jgi:hypothetical protein
MRQQVIVTTEATIALKPLLESAIRSELRLLDLGLARTSQRLRAFEDQYDLSSEDFERRFATGELGESLDYIEWAGEIKTYHLLKAQQETLQKVQLH